MDALRRQSQQQLHYSVITTDCIIIAISFFLLLLSCTAASPISNIHTTIPIANIQNTTWKESWLHPSSPTPWNNFGSAVTIQNSVISISAINGAYIYERDQHTGSWTETQRLTLPQSSMTDLVDSASILSNKMLVFTNGDQLWTYKRGHRGQWRQDTNLFPLLGDSTYTIISVRTYHDHTIAVLATQVFNTTHRSHAIILHKPFRHWERQWSVACQGACAIGVEDDFVVIGDPSPNNDQGEAWVYWRQGYDAGKVPLVPDHIVQETQLFGGSLTTRPDAIFVSGRYSQELWAIYVYSKRGREFVQTQVLMDPGKSATGFGTELFAYQNCVVVGSPHANTHGIEMSGEVYLFTLDDESSQWKHTRTVEAKDGATTDMFGSSVALWDNMLIVGSRWKNQGVLDKSGKAYLFELPESKRSNTGSSSYPSAGISAATVIAIVVSSMAVAGVAIATAIFLVPHTPSRRPSLSATDELLLQHDAKVESLGDNIDDDGLQEVRLHHQRQQHGLLSASFCNSSMSFSKIAFPLLRPTTAHRSD